jgi:hypothetical protein
VHKDKEFTMNTCSCRTFFFVLCSVVCLFVGFAFSQSSAVYSASDTGAIAGSARIAPAPGGTLRLLSHRTFFDETFSQLIGGILPVYGNVPDSQSALCSITKISDTKISIALAPHAVNARGKALTSFDLVTAWTDVVRWYPSEGRAIFRYLKGIDAFIAGHEALIQGFNLLSENTVQLTLSQPDTSVLQRLTTANILPSALKTGAYRIVATAGLTQTLLPTIDTVFNKAFLDTCYVTLGIKDNPFISYTLNKLNLITFFTQKDIAYARSILTDNSTLCVLANDRYFLALSPQVPPELRAAIAGSINKADILNNGVFAEGTVLNALQNDSAQAAALPALQTMPIIKAPLSIIFNNGDPASLLIAQKLAADLPKAGIPCVVNGCNGSQYDQKLLHTNYDIAIGWVASAITKNVNAQLRLATMWFNDSIDESQRIAANCELPLFTINTYALYRSYIGFYNDAFAGIYIKE